MRIIAVLILAATLAGAGYFFYFAGDTTGTSGQRGGPPPGFAIPVETAKVTVETYTRSVPAVGTLRSAESVIVRPEIAGRIATIGFEEGKPVAKDAVLFTLDDRIARAELNEAKANLTLSQRSFERASRLLREKVGTVKARDEALAALRAGEARVAVAQQRLAKTIVRAPFAGIVGLRRVSPGDYVNVGQDIVNLEQIELLKVDFRVAELELPRIKSGQEVRVRADAVPGRTYTGKVYAIDPAIDPEGRSIGVRAEIDNSEHALRPGLFVRIELETDRFENAIFVPEEAVVPEGKERFVFRVAGGKAQRTKIKTGARRTGMVHVIEGLGPGDEVVTAGQIKLRDGVPVKAVGGGPKAAGAPPGKAP